MGEGEKMRTVRGGDEVREVRGETKKFNVQCTEFNVRK